MSSEEFETECPHCGAKFMVAARERYRYVKCKSCGAGFVVGAAKASVLQCAKSDPRPVAPPAPGASRPSVPPVTADMDDVKELPPEERKPKLAVRRPVGNAGSPSAQSCVSSVEMRYSSIVRKRRNARIRELCWNVFSIVFLIGFVYVGYHAWVRYRSGQWPWIRETDEDTVVSHADADNGENVPLPVQSDMPRSPAPPPAKTVVEPSATEIQKTRYDGIVSAFCGTRLSFWQNLKKQDRPGFSEGVFIAALPVSVKKCDVYEIVSEKDGISCVAKVRDRGDDEKQTAQAFTKTIDGCGGLVCANGVSYALLPKLARNARFNVPAKGGRFDPSKEYLGALNTLVDMLGLDASRVSYDVRFAFDGGKDSVKVATVRHGDSIDYELFEKVASPIAQEMQRKRAYADYKTKKYKRTVVFYDGAYISRGIKGVTKVPRSFHSRDSRGYNEWVHLRDEARRQEYEAARVADENNRRTLEWKRKVNGPPDASLVAQVLSAGDVIVLPKAGGER